MAHVHTSSTRIDGPQKERIVSRLRLNGPVNVRKHHHVQHARRWLMKPALTRAYRTVRNTSSRIAAMTMAPDRMKNRWLSMRRSMAQQQRPPSGGATAVPAAANRRAVLDCQR